MKSEGFTLIEILIYAFLLAITVTLIIGIVSNFLFIRGVFLTREEISRSVTFLLEDIIREIKTSDQIIYPAAGASASELILQRDDQLISLKLKDGVLVKDINGNTFTLSPHNLKIDFINFQHLKQSPVALSSVRIKIGVRFNNPLHLKSYEFSTTFQTASIQSP